jgi:hypothetical protein
MRIANLTETSTFPVSVTFELTADQMAMMNAYIATTQEDPLWYVVSVLDKHHAIKNCMKLLRVGGTYDYGHQMLALDKKEFLYDAALRKIKQLFPGIKEK